MSRRSPHRSCGFTLVEVVVSIALFALLMSLVYGAFGTAVRAHDAGVARTDEGSAMRVVSEFLHNSIAAASPVAAREGSDWAVLFGGGGERLSYVSDLPGHVGSGGLHQIVVELERVDGKERLVMRRRPVVLDRDGEVEGEFQTRVLLPESDGFAVRFFGSIDDEEPRWQEEWAGSRKVPLLVELTVSPHAAATWPTLRIRPRADSVRYLGSGARRGVPRGGDDASDPARDPAAAPVPGNVPAAPAPSARIQ